MQVDFCLAGKARRWKKTNEPMLRVHPGLCLASVFSVDPSTVDVTVVRV